MPRYIGYKPTGTANSSVSITAISPLSPFSADGVLVVAGGGAGGGNPGYYKGGGGAGGYRAFTSVPILAGTSYTVVVGAGGSGPAVVPGSPSSFSGPNLPAPTYTSDGGGHGNEVPWPGGPGAGGSGGGLPGYQTGAPVQKVGNTPPTSPPQGNPGGVGSGYGGGAGGGAGGAGGAGSGNGKGGNGGPGATWAFNGTTYAGGGGGGNGQDDPGSFGAGGPGGGGRGSGGSGGGGGQNADPGTTNTGGGGGGRTWPGVAPGSGGSGIVIVAVPPSIAPAITGGTQSVAPAPAGGKTLITSTSPNTLTVATTSLQTTVDKKYNSGIWSISGTGTSSVYGRRKQGNWLTTNRGATGWVKIVLLGQSQTTAAGAPAPSLNYQQGGTTEYVMSLGKIAGQTLSIKTTPAAPGGPGGGGKGGQTGGRGIILATSTVPTPGASVPITFQPNLLAVVGGSGGEGGTVSGFETSFVASTGGSGGGPVGQTQPGGAGGGTQSAGGTGSPGATPGSPGAYLVGGAGGSGFPGPPGPEGPKGGGGGGGGYFGGGGAGGTADPGEPFNGKGGGGGSGFANTTHPYHYSSSTVQGRTRYSPIYPLGPGNPNAAVFIQVNDSINELNANTKPYTNLNISNDTAHTITFNSDGTYIFV